MNLKSVLRNEPISPFQDLFDERSRLQEELRETQQQLAELETRENQNTSTVHVNRLEAAKKERKKVMDAFALGEATEAELEASRIKYKSSKEEGEYFNELETSFRHSKDKLVVKIKKLSETIAAKEYNLKKRKQQLLAEEFRQYPQAVDLLVKLCAWDGYVSTSPDFPGGAVAAILGKRFNVGEHLALRNEILQELEG